MRDAGPHDQHGRLSRIWLVDDANGQLTSSWQRAEWAIRNRLLLPGAECSIEEFSRRLGIDVAGDRDHRVVRGEPTLVKVDKRSAIDRADGMLRRRTSARITVTVKEISSVLDGQILWLVFALFHLALELLP